MAVTRWKYRPERRDPFELMRREFDRHFGPWSEDEGYSAEMECPVDLREEGDYFYVEAELPGFRRDQVKVNIEDGTLYIHAERETPERKGTTYLNERRYYRVERQITLPATVDPSDVEARMEDGVLQMKIKKSVKARQQLIQIR